MASSTKEWLKEQQKTGAYYQFEDKSYIGEKLFYAILNKRKNGFYLDDESQKEGFIASVYGVYELLSIADDFLDNKKRFFKKVPPDVQISLANEIKGIYEHIANFENNNEDNGFVYDFSPVISNRVNTNFFCLTEETAKGKRQKYPYFGTMTWILSLSSLLWKKYFSYTETGEKNEIKNTDEIISDQAAVDIIRGLEGIIKRTIRQIVRLFANMYIKPSDVDGLNVKAFGKDNEDLIALAKEDGLKFGWGYTKGVKTPSLYFTFSILEAFSDFDSNILIGGKDDDYFDATPDEIERGLESTKNTSAYDVNKRFFNSLIDYINSDEIIDEYGNRVQIPNKQGIRYENEFRKAATQCGYYLFYKFKDSISDSFYNDDGYVVSREQIMLSSTSPSVFYPLYILSSLLNGEVNGTIKTKLMYTKRCRNELDEKSTDPAILKLKAEADKQIKALEAEYRQFEACFTDGLNNVQKIYTYMEKNDKLDVIDRHYLTFDQMHPDDPQFSRMLSRENILAMPLLPLLVNVTNLYVLWITQFPDKQISAYIMDIFEYYCNHDEHGNLEWVFEQGSYDLHATVRYVDAINNFFTYYEKYEKYYSEREKLKKDIVEKTDAELKTKYENQVKSEKSENNKKIEEYKKKIEELNRQIEESDKKYSRVFDVENSSLLRLTEIFNQYVDGVHSDKETPHAESIQAFVKALFRVAILMGSSNSDISDTFTAELIDGLKFMFEKRSEKSNNSLTGMFKTIIGSDKYIFENIDSTPSDQE